MRTDGKGKGPGKLSQSRGITLTPSASSGQAPALSPIKGEGIWSARRQRLLIWDRFPPAERTAAAWTRPARGFYGSTIASRSALVVCLNAAVVVKCAAVQPFQYTTLASSFPSTFSRAALRRNVEVGVPAASAFREILSKSSLVRRTETTTLPVSGPWAPLGSLEVPVVLAIF